MMTIQEDNSHKYKPKYPIYTYQ